MPLSQNFNQFSIVVSGLSGSRGATNNTTKVIIVNPPETTDYLIQIPKNGFSIRNNDTTSGSFVSFVSSSLGIQEIDNFILQPGDKWTSADDIIINETDTYFCIKLTNPVQTNQFLWNVSFNRITKG